MFVVFFWSRFSLVALHAREKSLIRQMSREMASKTGTRVETDTMGPMTVKADRYWGAQTQRSIENFAIGEPSERMPMQIVKALGIVKKAAVNVNLRFGIIDKKLADAINQAAGLVFVGRCVGFFFVFCCDVFAFSRYR